MIASFYVGGHIMAQILVRDLDKDTVERLKRRAKQEGRSLQSEVKAILEQAVPMDMKSAREFAGRIRKRFAGRRFGDSAELIREDRER
jgi:antitoxin FitA